MGFLKTFNTDRSREIRLWLGQIIIPAGLALYVFKDDIKEGFKSVKEAIKDARS